MTSHNMWDAARRYLAAGMSVIPCRANKTPVTGWRRYTAKRATLNELDAWFKDGRNQSIGLVGGAVSENVVFIDLDGIPAIRKFAFAFPELCESTYSVLTGSQIGIHLYVRVDDIPNNINVRVPGVGGFEIRGNGQYVIAPPSIHPSGNRYTIYRNRDIVQRNNLNDVYEWMQALRADQVERAYTAPRNTKPIQIQTDRRKVAYMSKVLGEEIERVRSASTGERNSKLFYAALRLANYAAGGEVHWSKCSDLLFGAGITVGLPKNEVERTIASAWRIGSKRPKVIP